jgi:23S rRNA pseudouridine1911/1915/1917 synthase
MPSGKEVLAIDQSQPSARLDSYLRTRLPNVSRGTIQRLIEEGLITVNGKEVKPTHKPRAGETVEITWPEAKPAVAQPEEMPLAILYEDDRLLVLNKAPGVVVHPAAGHEEHTLVNALLHHCKGGLSGIGGVARPGIVHRLDKDTSGCLVVAKNDETHLALSAQFAGRTVQKTYLGLLCGILPRDSGAIRAAIARHPSHRKRMAVDDEFGREALTGYEVVERLGCATLVKAFLHTGRTHQIRVHFQFLGFPLVGDATYGNRQNQRLEELAHFAAKRQMLHSWQLSFIHPRSGEKLHFEAPLPEDMREAVEILRGIRES